MAPKRPISETSTSTKRQKLGLPWERISGTIPDTMRATIMSMVMLLLSNGVLQSRAFKMFGKTCKQPRKSCNMGANYKYSGIVQSSERIPDEMHDLLERLGEIADIDYSNLINRVAIVVNYYAGGEDNIGWHADDEPCIDQSYPIVSVSFGATRDFKIRKKADHKEVYKLPLADCDVLVMQPGMQGGYQHSLPKRAKVDCPRINITVRIVK